MKLNIPDALKSDVPQTLWGKVLTATPVVMTVVATMLAGLASSEMTRAQYSRSLAAQQQSKAGSQAEEAIFFPSCCKESNIELYVFGLFS